MASKDDYEYTWVKEMYHVETPVANEIQVGDEITVEDRNGGSPQRVLSVTTMKRRSGKEYKVLLLESLEQKAKS